MIENLKTLKIPLIRKNMKLVSENFYLRNLSKTPNK